MKLHIFNIFFNKKLRTKKKINIFILFLIAFFTIIVLFLFIDSQQSKLSNVEQALAECLNNHHYHAAVRWNETPIIGKLFKKQLPPLNGYTDCIDLRLLNIDEKVKAAEEMIESMDEMKESLRE